MRLSVCMIVKNEEANLARCLSQVAGKVDEIVVVDTGSVDRTKEIASRFTDKVFDFEWIDDFSAARNFSFSKATKDYIMWLDADDFISKANREKLYAFKETFDEKYKGVYMPYAHTEQGVLISTFPRLRIVKRDMGFQWRDRIHETLFTQKRVKPEEYLNSDIVISQEIKPRGTTTRYLEILGNIVSSGGAELRSLQLYASELEKHEKKEEAIAVFERYFVEGGLADVDCLSACLQLGALYEKTDKPEKAIALYGECMPYCGDFAEYCCALGNIYLETAGDAEEAVFWYSAALNCEKPKNRLVLDRYYYYVPNFRLYQIYEAAKDKARAEFHLLRALEEMKKLETAE